MSERKLLEITNVSKSFSGVTVFSEFDFDLYAGEAHCLCGENGAGKSTFIKILSGAYQPDGGEIVIDGKKVEGKLNPAISMDLGVQTIYQEHTLMLNMNVMDNLFVGKELTKSIKLDRKAMYDRTIEILKELGVTHIDPLAKADSLGSADKKYVEIAKAFIKKAKVMIMDEPTASFSAHEIALLLEVVNNLKKSGIGIIYISHHLEEIFSIADRVTVIRDGRKIRTYDKSVEALDESAIIRDMINRDPNTFFSREETKVGDVVLKVKNISGPGVENVSFEVHRGEVLGFAGLVGAGRTEMAEILFGKNRATSGQIILNGKEITVKSPKSAVKQGLCMITEDRQLTGLCITQKISLNASLSLASKNNMVFMNPKKDYTRTIEYINKLKIKCKGPDQEVQYLSGGNQQKVIFCKWFLTDGLIYIFDEPTKGVDIGAKQDIYHLMVELCKAGKAIIMISSDLPEVVAMSDRVIIMKNGKVTGEIEKEEINSETIMNYALGGSVK